MRYAFLTILFLLVSASACAQTPEEKGRVPEGTVAVDSEVQVMFSRRTVICLPLKQIDQIMKKEHGEFRAFAAETNENGADGFTLFLGDDSWTAVELIGGKGCIIQSGGFWAGALKLPGNSL